MGKLILSLDKSLHKSNNRKIFRIESHIYCCAVPKKTNGVAETTQQTILYRPWGKPSASINVVFLIVRDHQAPTALAFFSRGSGTGCLRDNAPIFCIFIFKKHAKKRFDNNVWKCNETMLLHLLVVFVASVDANKHGTKTFDTNVLKWNETMLLPLPVVFMLTFSGASLSQ